MAMTEDSPALPAASAPALVPMLRVLYPPAAAAQGARDPWGQILQIGETRIGREVSGVMTLTFSDDRRMSGCHAAVTLRAGAVVLRDLGSRNGSFVNGRLTSKAQLGDGDLVRLGDTLLLYRLCAAGAAIPDPLRDQVWGAAPAMVALRRDIERVGPERVRVHIHGESGAGKEVVARALHVASGRTGAFVPINCGAIPQDLIESQLFGHKRGAFTGAHADHDGVFMQAHRGTLFLDEIGELPLHMQAKLLRVLEEGKVVPLCARAPEPFETRVISATARDLQADVRRQTFRGDLYIRLASVELRLPPLRERREDILTFLFREAQALGRPLPRVLDPALVEALLLYRWPYNVREVARVVARLLVLRHSTEDVVRALRADVADAAEGEAPLPGKEALAAALQRHPGNISAVSRDLGVSRRTVRRWLEQTGAGRDSAPLLPPQDEDDQDDG